MTRTDKNRSYCKELFEARAKYNELKKRIDELTSYLKIETGEENTDFGTWTVEFNDRHTESVDTARLKEEAPEVFERYKKTTDTKVLKVKPKK